MGFLIHFKNSKAKRTLREKIFHYFRIMDFTTNTVSKITDYVEALNVRDQEKLLSALERKALLDEAKRLNKLVKKNSVTIQEICDIVNDVRKKRKRA